MLQTPEEDMSFEENLFPSDPTWSDVLGALAVLIIFCGVLLNMSGYRAITGLFPRE